MLKAMTNLNVYKIPSNKIRQNRKSFLNLHRNDAEPINLWLDRVESAINRCEYPVFAKFLLIDKFVSEINDDEIELMLRSDVRRRTWSYKQLREYAVHKDMQKINGDIVLDKNAESNDEMIPLNLIKSEPVSELKT